MLRNTVSQSAPQLRRAFSFFIIFAVAAFGLLSLPAFAQKSASWLFEQADPLEELLSPQSTRPDILWMRGSVDAPSSVKYTPDGQYIAVLQGSSIKITRVTDGILFRTIFVGGLSRSMSISPNGQFGATAIENYTTPNLSTVNIYRLSDGELERTLPMQYPATAVAFSPDSSKILSGEQITGTYTQSIKIWNVADGSLVRSINDSLNGSLFFNGNPFTPDGSKIAIGQSTNVSNPEKVYLVNISSGATTQITTNTIGATYNFSPNGRYLSDGYGMVDTQCGNNICGYMQNVFARGSVAFSADGEKIALSLPSGGADSRVRLYNVSDWSIVREYQVANLSSDFVVAFSPNSQTVAATTFHFLSTRDVSDATGVSVRQLGALAGNSPTTIAFSADGQTIATGSSVYSSRGQNGLQLWNAADGSLKNVNFSQSVNYSIGYVAFTPDGQTLITEGYPGANQSEVRFWNAATGSLIRSLSGGNIRLSPDGNYYTNVAFNAGASTNYIEIRRVSDDSLVRSVGVYFFGGCLGFTPDSQQVVAFGGQYVATLQVYNISDGLLAREYNPFQGEGFSSTAVQPYSISPDGSKIAFIFFSGKVRIVDFLTGNILQTMTPPNSRGISIKFSPDGQNLLTSAWDGMVRIWRVSDGALVQTYDRETGGAGFGGDPFHANQVLYSPNNSRIAWGRRDGALVMARNPYATTPTTTFTINGQITRSGSALSGVSIALSGSSLASTTTDANGNYSFTVNEGGSYVVTPTLAGNNFTPPSQAFNFIAQNETANFTASLITFTISGNVKSDGANLAGATVSLSGGQSASTTTDANGNYSFTVPAGANYAVSVYKNGINFNPASQSFTNLQANQTANFQNGAPYCAPPPSGLVGWWKGENNLADSSSNGNIFNSANGTGYATGKVGQGFNTNAFGAYFYAFDSPSLSPTSQITLDAWINPTSAASGAIISKYERQPNQVSYALLVSGGKIQLNLSSNGSNARDIFSVNSVVPVGTWSHVAATFDTNGQTARLYLNGVEVASELLAGSSTIPSIFDSNSWLRIGGLRDANGNHNGQFIGVIDEPQIYNRALSASEIQSIYNAGSAGVCTQAQLPAANGKVAFASTRTGNYEIFTMNADGSNQTNVSNNAADDYEPSWSPDGGKIAFTSNRNSNNDIYVMNADGSNQIRLTTDTNNDYVPSWSPDGTKIVFYSDRTGSGDIYAMNADGSNQIRLTNSPAQDYAPRFSPDGSKILFQSIRDGNYEIYVMNADGSNQTRLTNNSAYDEYPAFSPDGSKIVFDSNSTGNFEIFVMNADGSNPVNLSNNPANDSYPAWSPDGSKITFTSTRDGNNEIYVMNAGGTNQTRLTNNTANDYYPSWQAIRNNPNTGNGGTLDTTFNSTGKVITPIGSSVDDVHSIAIQSDGKIVAAGSAFNGSNYDFALARYNTDGTLDSSFGTGGKIITPIGNSNDFAYSVAVQLDGKIIASGQSIIGSISVFALVRYNSDGSLDSAFGSGGKVFTPINNTNYYATSMIIQPDGKSVIAGYGYNGSNSDFALARYNTDGSFDNSFGTSGVVLTPVSSSHDYALSLAIQSNGKLVAAGYILVGSNSDFAVARYNTDGTLDTSFSSDGKVSTPVGSGYDQANAVAIQSDGKIVAIGRGYNGSNDDFALVRYQTDGSLDTSFGTTGIILTPIGTSNDFALGGAIQSDGKIVAVGNHNDDFDVVRYNTDGSLDPSFGTGGKVTEPIGDSFDVARTIAIQPDSKLIVAGNARNGSNDDFALARFSANSSNVSLASNLRLNFSNILQAGNTVATPITPASAGALPSGYRLISQSVAYDIRTSAQFSGNITTTINVPNVPDSATCQSLRLLHYETSANGLLNVTSGTNAYNSTTQICTVSGVTTNLSPFVIAQVLAPTAASVSISGRVITPQDLGLTNARVTLTDSQGNSRTTATGKFGNFRFTNVTAGGTYIVSVTSRRYTYAPQVITVNEELTDLSFAPQ